MVNKDKSQGLNVNVNAIIIVAIALLILIGLIAIFTDRTELTEQGYCNLNPNECVCEEWEQTLEHKETGTKHTIRTFIRYNFWDYNTLDFKCIDYRKLTSEEKAIKDCNENPREDEDCKCVEEKIIITTYGGDFPSNTPPHKSIKCTSSTPKPKPIEINLEEEKCVEHTNNSEMVLRVIDANITECQLFSIWCKSLKTNESSLAPSDACDVHDKDCCTKKEQLTPCEKGDENWVEEIKSSCGTFRKDQWELHKELEPKKSQCNYIETTCRPKTEEEVTTEKEEQNKEFLLSKSCDELEYLLRLCIENPNLTDPKCNVQLYENLKTAWRNKECQV